MKVKPMIFNTEMVRALLDGRKVQTRRPMPEWQKPKKNVSDESGMEWISIVQRGARWGFALYGNTENECMSQYTGWLCPFAAPGDLIYVRETFSETDIRPAYLADSDDGIHCVVKRWTPSIHMPRWASRLTLKVTGVRVERVQDISATDCIAEGFQGGHGSIPGYMYSASPKEHFSDTWKSIYGESWERNDWVWVIDFEVIRQNVDDFLKTQERAA